MNLLEALKERDLVHQHTPGLEKALENNKVVGYVGFDPTAKSLHVGNLVAIMLLKHLQMHGHTPIILVGGATGMIGDPSGKKDERQFLSEEILIENQESIKKQLSRFLDFFGDNAAILVNNYDWTKDLSIIDFLRIVGKNVTVNSMMNRDSVKNRIDDEDKSISFTEFSYQLLQAYDFAHLYKTYNCTLQMGGSDQWGNMTAGIELIRKLNITTADGAQPFTNAITCPLLTKSDGSKFGKSESGNIWLDASMTSPFEFFQFWYQHNDEEAVKLLKFFTFVPMSQIPDMIENQKKNPTLKYLQHKLAEQVTLLVHGRKGLDEALAATDFLYNDEGSIDKIAEMTVEQFKRIFATVPQTTILKAEFENSDIFDVLSNKSGNKIFSSKGDVRRTFLNGGLYINKQKLTEATKNVKLLNDRFWIIQKGKKNFNILEIV